MIQKCCLNCAYLCRLNDEGNRQSLTEQQRSTRDLNDWGSCNDTFQIAHDSVCYHDQWKARGSTGNLEDDVTSSPSEDTKAAPLHVLLENGEKLYLEDSTDCEFFNAFNVGGTKPVDRIWRDYQNTVNRRRFWIPTGISIAAIIIAGLSLFRSW